MCSNQAQSIDTGKGGLWSQKWWWWTGAMSRGEVDGFSIRALAKVQDNPGQLPPPSPLPLLLFFPLPFLLFFSLVLSVLSRFCRARFKSTKSTASEYKVLTCQDHMPSSSQLGHIGHDGPHCAVLALYPDHVCIILFPLVLSVYVLWFAHIVYIPQLECLECKSLSPTTVSSKLFI